MKMNRLENASCSFQSCCFEKLCDFVWPIFHISKELSSRSILKPIKIAVWRLKIKQKILCMASLICGDARRSTIPVHTRIPFNAR
jgi:hypothetical protein